LLDLGAAHAYADGVITGGAGGDGDGSAEGAIAGDIAAVKGYRVTTVVDYHLRISGIAVPGNGNLLADMPR
jgi:Pyruvate/2-oxoacid:ferredoxin oxidoreductase gamma subunit